MDIRLYTRVIVLRDRKYLVGKDEVMDTLRWSDSPWDAWWTRNAEDARKVAEKTGGVTMLFNPVVGRVAAL